MAENNVNERMYPDEKTVVKKAVDYWCDAIVARANPDLENNCNCPWFKHLLSKSVSKGYVLSEDNLAAFRVDLETVITESIKLDDRTFLSTENGGPTGLLLEVSQRHSIPDDLFPERIQMLVSTNQVSVTNIL